MDLCAVACLVLVGLCILGALGGVIFELIGDAFEFVLDTIGPIGVLVVGLVALGCVCGTLSAL